MSRNESQTGVKSKPARTPRQDDDYDDDSANINIRRRRRRKSSKSKLWLILLLAGGGLMALLVCVGFGIGGYFLFFRDRIVGQWELTDPQINGRLTVEFKRDGTGMIQGPGADVHFDYTFERKNPMTLEWKITRVDPRQQIPFGPVGRLPFQPIIRLPMFANAVGLRERFRVNLDGPTLRLTPDNNNVVLAFRRVR